MTRRAEISIPTQPFLDKRRAIESGQLRSWKRKGRTWLHPKREWLVRLVLRTFLRGTFLLERGERNAQRPALANLNLEFENLPAAFDGFRLLHISDVHANGFDEAGQRLADLISGIEADLCLLTGDYKFEVAGPWDAAYPVMEAIAGAVRSRYGIAGILGNHDSLEMLEPFEELGIKMLVNQNWEIKHRGETIHILGVDDPHYFGCDDLASARANLPEDSFKILMAHSPEIIPEAEAEGIHLYLCGHTHGGQICLPGIGALHLNANCERKYASGYWRHGRMQGHTSRGVGSSCVPVRFACPPEISLVTLHRREALPRRIDSLNGTRS